MRSMQWHRLTQKFSSKYIVCVCMCIYMKSTENGRIVSIIQIAQKTLKQFRHKTSNKHRNGRTPNYHHSLHTQMKPFASFKINTAWKQATSRVRCKQQHHTGTVENQHWNKVNFVSKTSVLQIFCARESFQSMLSSNVSS